MCKLFLSIAFTVLSMLPAHAQDDRYEYRDTSLLKETIPSTEQEMSIFRENGAEEKIAEEKDILSDTSLYISPISISPDTIRAWKSDRRFAYIHNLDSLLKIKQAEDLAALKENKVGRTASFLEKVLSSGILQGLFWIVAIGFVLFILYKLFLSDGVFKRNTVTSPVNAEQEEEAVVSVADYDKLIRQSFRLGDYRLAVRYLFLKTLVQLTDKEYLQQSPDKTNYQYVQEIRAEKKNEFSSLVLLYEYTWYGNTPVTQEQYSAIEKKFTSFHQKL